VLLFERALAIDEALYGPDHPEVGACLNNLALALHNRDRPEQAKPLQERALAIAEAAYGPDDPRVATSLSNLAENLRVLGYPEEAQEVLQRRKAVNPQVVAFGGTGLTSGGSQ